MRNYRRDCRAYLQRHQSWVYHEVVAEAFVVLWVACQLSGIFAVRILRNWRPTRTDPRSKSSFDFLLNLLGYDVDGCFWDRVLSFWQRSDEIPLNHRLHSVRFGYVGVYLSLCATAILFLWFSCYLLANRSWRLPLYKSYHVPFCSAFSRFFRYAHSDSPYVIAETVGCGSAEAAVDTVEVVTSSETDSNTQIDQRPPFYTIRDVPACLRGWVSLGYLLFAVVPFMFLSVFVWVTILTIPLVWTAGFLARIVVMQNGDETVFPCCVALIAALSAYCCGRMSGLWMQESYLWSLWNKFRTLRDGQPVPLQFDANTANHCVCEENETQAYIFRTWEVWLGLFSYGAVVLDHADSLFELSHWHPFCLATNCISNSSVDVTFLKPVVAVVSYWTDVSQILVNTTNVTLAPDLSVISQTTGKAFMVWSGATTAIAFLFAFGSEIGCCIALYCSACEAPQPARERSELPFCACLPWMGMLRIIIHFTARPLMWYLLPWTLTQFLLPEQLQLPGILLILTIILAWVGYAWIRHVKLQWKNGDIVYFMPFSRWLYRRKATEALANLHPDEENAL
ncbi:uncharacterized protein LOC129592889 [Paramacrobiotus metropolitanus]|uniref:uncharacterized protein LOC129592889 n=1 Tax=Paramacrobiotus metropolitanus TaxID=2943436 RepID=UPI0024461093|nr:uncharacterized protein LOC129592889 [Paramacrobiotus metropolitanus]